MSVETAASWTMTKQTKKYEIPCCWKQVRSLLDAWYVYGAVPLTLVIGEVGSKETEADESRLPDCVWISLVSLLVTVACCAEEVVMRGEV